MNLSEIFDQHKLNYLIQHQSEYPLPNTVESETRIDYLKTIFGADYNPYKIASRYLKNSKNGTINVNYKQTENRGRLHASVSLQGMPVEIRHTIAPNYKDIDIKNAHPVILEWICNSRNIKCKKLSYYISNRNECLESLVGCSKDVSKQTVLSMLNGGSKLYKKLTQKPEWIVELKAEIKVIHATLAKDKDFKKHSKAREKNGNDYNHEGSYMNILLCRTENDVLQIIYQKLGSPHNAVLCFDGIMVLKNLEVDFALLQNEVFEKLGINIELVEKPMDLGFTLPDDIPDYNKKDFNSFDYNIKYDYGSFYNEFNQYTFKSYEDLDDVISEKYPLVINKVISGKGSYCKKINGSENKVDVVNELKLSDFTMLYTESLNNSDNTKKLKIKLSEFLDRKVGLVDYECKIFHPNPKNFNLWSGFEAKEIDNYENDKGLALLQKMILDTWADGDIENYNYIISWFKGLLVNEINRVAMVLISDQGTGKGWLCNFLRYIINNSNVAECCGIENVVQKHNTYIQNKRLVIINEMASTRDEFRSNFDKLKPFITDPYLKIEPKARINPYTIDNIGNYILCSNHIDSIILEETDRRYAIFKVSNKYMQNKDYFEDLTEKCYNTKTADAFYSYLLYFDDVDINAIPNTKARQEILNLSKPNAVKFLDFLKEEPLTRFNQETGEVENIKEIKSIDLYEKYKNWCSQNGERNVVSNTKFGLILKDRLVKKRNKLGNVYVLED